MPAPAEALPSLGASRCLVTGGAGFIGVNLCRHLASLGASVEAVVRPNGNPWRLAELGANATVHALDLRDAAATARLMAHLKPDFLFHAAAHSAYDPSARLGDRVGDALLSLASVLDASVAVPPLRIVLLGSSLAYGPSSEPHREEDSLRPTSLRGAIKAASSLLSLAHAGDRGLALTELRLFSVYGPWEPLHRLVPRAIAAVLEEGELPLTPPGARRDFVFIDDVVRACALAATADESPGKVINVGSGRETSNEELVASVATVLDQKAHVLRDAYPLRATDTPHWRADVERARILLDWKPEHSLEEGLEITAAWYRRALRKGGEQWLRAGGAISLEGSGA